MFSLECGFDRNTYYGSFLTLPWRRPLWYRNQSIDLLCKSIYWFLYDNGLRHERVKSPKVVRSFFKKNCEWSRYGSVVKKKNQVSIFLGHFTFIESNMSFESCVLVIYGNLKKKCFLCLVFLYLCCVRKSKIDTFSIKSSLTYVC